MISTYFKKVTSFFKKPIFLVFTAFLFCKKFINSKLGTGNLNQSKTNLDKQLVYSLSKSKIPTLKQIKHVGKYLTKKEQTIINVLIIIILINSVFLGINYYNKHLSIIPVAGGEYTEALIGTPSYINPLYSISSDVNNDITKLIFSSLFKYDKNGNLINDIAQSYTISPDEKIYTIKIRNDVRWHNDEKLTIEDVAFTFNTIKDPQYKSPLRTSYQGVDLNIIDENTIEFILLEPYAAFLELLTFGILPQSYWSQISPDSALLAELNLKPIGSGPYEFKSLIKDKNGKIISYTLERFAKYHDQKPLLDKINFIFSANFEEAVAAFNENKVDGISYLPRNLKSNLIAQDSLNFYSLNLPEITSVFFNLNKNSSLSDVKVRQALAFAIDKNSLLLNTLNGESRAVNGPILPNSFAYNKDIKKYNFNLSEAESMLDSAGWIKKDISREKIDEQKILENALPVWQNMKPGAWRVKLNSKEEITDILALSLTTINNTDNVEVANYLKAAWENIGVVVNLIIITPSQIQTEVIKTKNFDVLLYSQIIGNDPDSYVFWHSSQAKEGGLNITGYNNKEVDKILEEARTTSNNDLRKEKYFKFQEIISTDVPAIFLYSPIYTYIQDKKIKNFDIKNIIVPSDRFNNIVEWYIKTGKKLQ